MQDSIITSQTGFIGDNRGVEEPGLEGRQFAVAEVEIVAEIKRQVCKGVKVLDGGLIYAFDLVGT